MKLYWYRNIALKFSTKHVRERTCTYDDFWPE